jgi:hypothetical protein
MDPQAGSSFIPKKALATSVAARGGAGPGLFFLIALFLFIASLVGAGAAFGYEQFLNSQIAANSQSLTLSEGAFDPGTVQDLVRTDERLTQAQTLLNTHVAPSALFDLLSTLALQNVQFTSLTYTLNGDGSAAIVVGGLADSFSTVALESDKFGAATPALKDVVFSNITVGATGAVSFTVNATVSAATLSYRSRITQQNSTSPSTTQSAASTASTSTTP